MVKYIYNYFLYPINKARQSQIEWHMHWSVEKLAAKNTVEQQHYLAKEKHTD